MEAHEHEITLEAKTFTAPGEAKCRALHWLVARRENTSILDAVLAMCQSTGDTVHNCEVLLDLVKESLGNYYFDNSYYMFEDMEKMDEKVRNLFLEMNRTLCSLSRKGENKTASLLLAITYGDELLIGNVGTYRAILIRDNAIHHLIKTPDGLVGEMANPSSMDPDEPESGQKDKMLLGNKISPPVQLQRIRLEKEDGILLVPDSVTGALDEHLILQLWLGSKDSLSDALMRMLDRTLDSSREKDITIIGLKVKERSTSAMSEEQHSEPQMLDQLPRRPPPKKPPVLLRIIIFLVSVAFGAIIGFFFLSQLDKNSSLLTTVISLQSTIELKRLTWQGVERKLEREGSEFRLSKGENGALFIEPDRNVYGCRLVLISDQIIRFQTDSSPATLPCNTLSLDDERILMRMNIFSRIDPINPEWKEGLSNGQKTCEISFRLGNLKGPIEFSSHNSRHIKEIRIQLVNFE